MRIKFAEDNIDTRKFNNWRTIRKARCPKMSARKAFTVGLVSGAFLMFAILSAVGYFTR